jgi:hypothetical protein
MGPLSPKASKRKEFGPVLRWEVGTQQCWKCCHLPMRLRKKKKKSCGVGPTFSGNFLRKTMLFVLFYWKMLPSGWDHHAFSGLKNLSGFAKTSRVQLVPVYPYSVPAVFVSVSGYRRVDWYTVRVWEGPISFFLKKTRCTRTRLPAARARTRPYNVFRNRYNGLLKYYNVS